MLSNKTLTMSSSMINEERHIDLVTVFSSSSLTSSGSLTVVTCSGKPSIIYTSIEILGITPTP